jgi:polyisoprenoid-binding protein YceI
MRKLLAAVFALRLVVALALAGDVYVVDRTRSEAKFEIRYLYSTVTGRMRDISGTINLDPADPTASSVKFSMMAGSVDTGSAELNRQLRSADFLNTAKFSQITFRSTSIRATAKTNVYQVIGELTLHGVTKRVMLPVEVGDVVRDGGELARAAFLVRTTLSRRDYGISWNKVLDHTAILVGDDLKVTVTLVASKQAPVPSN